MLGRDTWSWGAEALSVFPAQLFVIDVLGRHFEAHARLGSGQRLAQPPDDRSKESCPGRVLWVLFHRNRFRRNRFRGNGSL